MDTDRPGFCLLTPTTDHLTPLFPVPKEMDREVARLKLKSMGVKIDKLTKEQKEYLASWHLGT